MGIELSVSKFNIRKLNLHTVQTVLMIGAHPDDIEINAGGLNSILKNLGSNIGWLVCSDGGGGSWDSDIDRQQLTQTRKEEQMKAAEVIGISRVTFLDLEDGCLSFNQQQLLESIVKEIRDLKPRMIITHDPWKQYELHADHKAVGAMTSHAAIMASNSTFSPKGPSHFTEIIGYFNPESPNLRINISSFSETKDRAILTHKSQFGNRMTFVDTLRANETSGLFLKRRTEVFHFLKNQ